MRGALRIDVDTDESTLHDVGGELTAEQGRLLFDAADAGSPLLQIRRAPDGGGAEPDQPDPAPAVGTAADEGASAPSSAART